MGNNSPRSSAVLPVVAATLLEAAAIGVTRIDPAGEILQKALHSVAALILAGLAGVALGVPLARLASFLPRSVLAARVARRFQRLEEYSRQSGWPGRRYLDLLRSGDLAKQRREFLALGLDSYLHIPSTISTAEYSRLSTILVHLRRETAARGLSQLSATAHDALHQLRAYLLLERLRGGVLVFFYLALPAGMAYLNTLLVESIAPSSTPYFDGLSRVMLTIALLLGAPLVTYLMGQLLFFMTWTIGHRTESAIDDVILQSLSWIGAAIPGVAVLWIALAQIPRWPVPAQTGLHALVALFAPTKYSTLVRDHHLERFLHGLGAGSLFVLRVAAITGVTVLSIVLLRTLCNRVMRELAARTRQKYDDMMVELVRIFGTFILAATGAGWIFLIFLSGYGAKIDAGGSSGSFVPYAILIAVAGALLGVGSRQMLENFFAGVSLQVDSPFEAGERVVLEDGAVCEVRSIGMRSTHFYNITANADLYVPNTRLAEERVSNLSRPDRQHRRTLTVYARDSERSLVRAEDLVLLAAFTVEGVDIPTIIDERLESPSFLKGRPGLVAEFAKLQEHYDEASSAVVRLHGQAYPIGELVMANARRLSVNIAELNRYRGLIWMRSDGVPHDQLERRDDRGDRNEARRLQDDGVERLCRVARQVERGMSDLSSCFWTLGASYPSLRGELEPLSLEILRAPTVRSRQILTEEGVTVWELELSIYAHLTEQSDAILHDLNLTIQQLFARANLLPKPILRPDHAAS